MGITWNNASNIVHQLKVGLSRMPGEEYGIIYMYMYKGHLILARILYHIVHDSTTPLLGVKIVNNTVQPQLSEP